MTWRFQVGDWVAVTVHESLLKRLEPNGFANGKTGIVVEIYQPTSTYTIEWDDGSGSARSHESYLVAAPLTIYEIESLLEGTEDE